MENLSKIALDLFNKSIPALTSSLHKGSCGKIAIIGGCMEYTGAPFYAANTTLKLGGDLAYIICTKEAAIPIKSYSPEVIVFPLLEASDSESESVNSEETTKIATKIASLFNRFHAIVVGPGLGRDAKVLDTVYHVVQMACKERIPLVIDGDGLFLLTQHPDMIQGFNNVILTPNHIEFVRLWNSVMPEQPISIKDLDIQKNYEVLLANRFQNVTIFHKGETDVITDGKQYLTNNQFGSKRRCGGQGDLVAGSNGLFMHWTLHTKNTSFEALNPLICSAYASSLVVRKTQQKTFEQRGRTMTTPDLIEELGSHMKEFFPAF